MSTDFIEEKDENFEDLLEKSFSDMKSYSPGEAVEAEVLSISRECVFLQLNGKSEGIIDKEELLDEEGECSVSEGDFIKAYFLKAKNGEMHFTTKIGGEKADKSSLKSAFDNGIPVEGIVEKEIKGGFEIKIGDTRAFCPYSQMGERRVEDASEYLKQHLTFKITEYSERGRNILVSNRLILEEEKNKQIQELKTTISEGMVVEGVVTSIRDFGAFVNIDGVQALLPISEISRTRVDDINSVLSEGQKVKAEILNLDWKNEKISISMKSLTSDPWDLVKDNYKIGSTYPGKVVRITDFGAFVSLEPGLDGLLHISEMQGDSRDNNPRNYVKKGQELNVKINSIDTVNKRISLKMTSTHEEDENLQQYMEEEEETYNPFAAFMKNKK